MPDTLPTPPESVLITEALAARGWSQVELARRSGVPLATVRLALRGVRSRDGVEVEARPSDAVLAALGDALDLDAQALRETGRTAAADALWRRYTDRLDDREERGRETLALADISTDALLDELRRRYDELARTATRSRPAHESDPAGRESQPG